MSQGSAKETFLATFDEYNNAIFRFCLVKTSQRELAEDLTQETFMRYWQALREGKHMTNTRAFLYTIANNLVIDWYRKKRASSLDAMRDEGFEPVATNELDAESQSAHEAVIDTLKSLPSADREIILLHYVEGLDPKDIAEILEVSANVISVRIHRAIKKLQTKLDV